MSRFYLSVAHEHLRLAAKAGRERLGEVHRPRTAWLAPPGDPDALAAAIEEALGLNADQRFALGQIAMSHARESFGKERMCAQTLAVYQELLRSDAYAFGPQAA